MGSLRDPAHDLPERHTLIPASIVVNLHNLSSLSSSGISARLDVNACPFLSYITCWEALSRMGCVRCCRRSHPKKFTSSLTRLVTTYSLIRTLIHSLTDSLTHTPTLTRSPYTHSLTHFPSPKTRSLAASRATTLATPPTRANSRAS